MKRVSFLRKREFISILITLLLLFTLNAEVSHQLTGDVKWDLYVIKPAKGTEALTNMKWKGYMISQLQLRLRSLLSINDIFTSEIAASITSSYEQMDMTSSSVFTPSSGEYRLVDIPASSDLPWGSENTAKLYYNLDRVNATFSMPFADLIVGRQAISFGVGKYISPTDIYAPFAVQTLDRENRRGVDGVRMRIPFLDMNEVDIGWVFGEHADLKQSSGFVRTHLYFLKTDVTLILNYFKTNLMTGVSMTRSLGGAGIWFEAAYTAAGVFDDRKTGDDFVGITSGFDYQFSKRNFYMFLEYHYNSAGELHAENYSKNNKIEIDGFILQTGKTAYNDGAVYLNGQHYITWGASIEITSLISGFTMLVFNANDPSLMFIKRLTMSLADEVAWDIGFNTMIGKRMTTNSAGVPEIKSEFGLYPLMFYSNLKWYF